MSETTRRNILKTGALFGAGIASSAVTAPINAYSAPASIPKSKWDAEYDFGHKILFMEEYHRGTLDILSKLKGEIGHIGELSSKAVKVITNGGTVATSMNIGHMPPSEMADNRRGNPGIIKEHAREGKIDFSMLKKGDMVFTNFCSKEVRDARDRGVYIVAVTVNYVDNEFRPAGFTVPNEENLMLKDVSNDILQSHVPYNQGLVHAPEIPEMTLCPSTTTGSGATFWMINAEIANQIANKSAKPGEKGSEYLSILTEKVSKLTLQMDKIRETAVKMTGRIRSGGKWHVRSIEHPGISGELHGVASGPMIVNWGDWDKTKDKNVMLISAISPAFADEIKLAKEKKQEGTFVIAIGPSSENGKAPAEKLISLADTGFDNLSPELDGVIKIVGREKPICPTSGIMSNIIQQMITAQWTDEMVRRGAVPFYWMGFFQKGTDYNNAIKPFFEKQGF